MLENIGGNILESAGDQLVRNVVDTYVRTKIKNVLLNLKKDAKHEDELSLIFEKYLLRMYKKSENLNTIIFHKTPIPIEKVYVPLTLFNYGDKEEFHIQSEISKFIKRYNKVIITDSAGMGKSTVLKWMFRKILEEKSTIPILIELRKLNSNNSVIDEILKEINSISQAFDEDFLRSLLEVGGFTFFFDGYDEINIKEKTKVTSSLQEFMIKAHNNNFLLSSRPEEALNSFAGFYHFQLRPLVKDQAFDLIRKYAEIDNSANAAEDLIRDIHKEENLKNLATFLENPLMVTLLYKGYDYKQLIPYKKSIFYRQVYDSLFESHDLSKGDAFSRNKESGLDIESFHTVLRTLGFITFINNEVEYSRDKIIFFINQARNVSQIEFEPYLLLNDLQKNVPLFYREGNDYRWAHKSLQEYFVASYIYIDANEKQEKYLNDIYEKKIFAQYMNVFDLLYDMDYKIFKNTIILKLLKDLSCHLSSKKNKNFQWDFYQEFSIDLIEMPVDEYYNSPKIEEKLDSYERYGEEINKSWVGAANIGNGEILIANFSNEYNDLINFLFIKGEPFISFVTIEKEISEEEVNYLYKSLYNIKREEYFRFNINEEFWSNNISLFNIAIKSLPRLYKNKIIFIKNEKVLEAIKSIETSIKCSDILEI